MKLGHMLSFAKEWTKYYQVRLELALWHKNRGNSVAKHKYLSLIKEASESWDRGTIKEMYL